MERAGLTPAVAASKLGVSHQAVWQWMKGVSSPTVDNLARLMRLCRIDLQTFFGPYPPTESRAEP
jgi:transcriptional regulator with XRE-family HTH domain